MDLVFTSQIFSTHTYYDSTYSVYSSIHRQIQIHPTHNFVLTSAYPPLSQTHTHTHTYTYIHVHVHTHTHTHVHRHTHTHTGGKTTLKDSQWLTPLHHAAARGHESTVKELLRHHTDVMARDKNWMTPLHMAAYNNHVQVAGMCQPSIVCLRTTFSLVLLTVCVCVCVCKPLV